MTKPLVGPNSDIADPADLTDRTAWSVTVRRVGELSSGLAFTTVIAAFATLVQHLSGLSWLSPLVVAMALGMAIRNLFSLPEVVRGGIVFSLKRLLRLGIVLLGFQLTLSQIGSVGFCGIALITVTLVTTFLFTKWAGRILGVDRGLTELIAAGTSICGASAVIATNTVIRARDADVAYAVACVTVFGSLSMFLFPLVGAGLKMDGQGYGFWVGATVHEVAQVAATAFQAGEIAGHTGIVVKLTRVAMLAPVILVLGWAARRMGSGDKKAGLGSHLPIPWFVFGFVATIVLNSLIGLPQLLQAPMAGVTTFLLTIALAAMGLETDVGQLRAEGLRPLALGAVAWIYVSILGLTLVFGFL